MEIVKWMVLVLCGTIVVVVVMTILCIVAAFLFKEQYEAFFRLRPGFKDNSIKRENKKRED